MPEFMGKKITRAEESARLNYSKALTKSVGTRSKGTGWKSLGGSLFREQSGWFIEVRPSVYIYDHVTKAIVYVKPMAIDRIFWDIVGLPENNKQPLSFRANGAWTCPGNEFAMLPVEEDGGPDIVATRLIAIAKNQLEILLRSYSIEAFLCDCNSMATNRPHLTTVVTTLIAMKRSDEALTICEEAKTEGWDGGFTTSKGSFFEMAYLQLRHLLETATHH